MILAIVLGPQPSLCSVLAGSAARCPRKCIHNNTNYLLKVSIKIVVTNGRLLKTNKQTKKPNNLLVVLVSKCSGAFSSKAATPVQVGKECFVFPVSHELYIAAEAPGTHKNDRQTREEENIEVNVIFVVHWLWMCMVQHWLALPPVATEVLKATYQLVNRRPAGSTKATYGVALRVLTL